MWPRQLTLHVACWTNCRYVLNTWKTFPWHGSCKKGEKYINTILIKKNLHNNLLPTCTVNSFVEIVQYMQCTFSDHSSALGRYILSEQFSQDLVEKLLWKAVGKRRHYYTMALTSLQHVKALEKNRTTNYHKKFGQHHQSFQAIIPRTNFASIYIYICSLIHYIYIYSVSMTTNSSTWPYNGSTSFYINLPWPYFILYHGSRLLCNLRKTISTGATKNEHSKQPQPCSPLHSLQTAEKLSTI